MQQFRDLIKGWFGKVMLGLVILVFVFFGVEGILSYNSQSDVAITVNGEEILKPQISRAIDNQRQMLMQQMGGQMDASIFTDEMLRPQVEKALIQRLLIEQAVADLNMSVAPEMVKQYVRSLPQFQDENGAFSDEQLDRLLVRLNMSRAELFQNVRSTLVSEQLQAGLGASGFMTATEFNALAELSNQQRSARTVAIKPEQFKAEVTIEDDAIEAYYDEHQGQFTTEEQVAIRYVLLTPDDFTDEVEVDAVDVQRAYDAYVEESQSQAQRKASHILVEVSDERSSDAARVRIKEAQAALQAGESFAAVAKQYSDDVASADAGGDLGFAGKGVYEQPFEDALFALGSPGDVSDIVETEYGLHLIQLTEVSAAEVDSLEEQREALTAEIRASQAQELLDDAAGEIGRLAYESGDLDALAEAFELEIQTSPLFGRAGGEGITSDPAIIKAAFSEEVLADNLNSDELVLADGRVAVIHLDTHKEAEVRPLAEVKGDIEAQLVADRARELAEEKALAIEAALAGGEAAEAVAGEYGVEFKTSEGLTRQGSELPSAVVSKLFEMPRPAEDAASVALTATGEGVQWVVQLVAVTEGESDLSAEEQRQALVAGAQQAGNQDFRNFLEMLEKQADIERL